MNFSRLLRLHRLLCLGALLLAPAVAPAQESQMERRMDQAWRDALNGKGKAFVPYQKSETITKNAPAKAAIVQEFQAIKPFRAKDFLSGSYQGSKSFWMGEFKFNTTGADIANSGKAQGRVIPHLNEPHPTKALAVTDARESGKRYGVTEYATRKSDFRGTSQEKLDKEGPEAMKSDIGWTGNMQTMTLEQVRDLLNKNK